ncbi:hypothetical protein SLEP1_g32158 [Rubroshorea leprosula]|uniref:Protein kinase domain-containing protein n=1 Tax=Rubroshorea leprosula TaxID=152421 RepID=A0AAV5KCP3_9ROSI|nr:hypothetical protein SLEP1_g32158 [Rubroshorea leprosula]
MQDNSHRAYPFTPPVTGVTGLQLITDLYTISSPISAENLGFAFDFGSMATAYGAATTTVVPNDPKIRVHSFIGFKPSHSLAFNQNPHVFLVPKSTPSVIRAVSRTPVVTGSSFRLNWSAGVILYILLCGVPPFWAETEQGVAQAIIRSVIDFKRDPWPKVSENAKDLVKKMLDPDPRQRLTAQGVLEHPWLQNAKKAPNVPLGETVKARLKQFSVMNKLKKRALRVTVQIYQ